MLEINRENLLISDDELRGIRGLSQSYIGMRPARRQRNAIATARSYETIDLGRFKTAHQQNRGILNHLLRADQPYPIALRMNTHPESIGKSHVLTIPNQLRLLRRENIAGLSLLLALALAEMDSPQLGDRIEDFQPYVGAIERPAHTFTGSINGLVGVLAIQQEVTVSETTGHHQNEVRAYILPQA